VNDLKKVRLSIWYGTRMIQVPVPYYMYCVRVDFITGASRPCTAGIVPCSARAVRVFARTSTKQCSGYLSSLAVGSVGLCHENGGPNK